MTDFQIFLAGLGIALSVVLLPSVLNGTLKDNWKRAILLSGFCLYTGLNLANFLVTDSFLVAVLKSLSLAALMVASAVWMARSYRQHEAKRQRRR